MWGSDNEIFAALSIVVGNDNTGNVSAPKMGTRWLVDHSLKQSISQTELLLGA
jgi:hypothetical protein